MKHILLLGATGRTGIRALEYALSKGYVVTALVRNPEKIKIQSEKIKVITGTPVNLEDVREAIDGCEAVISTLNNPRTSDLPWAKIINPPTLMADSMRNVVIAMNEKGIKRIVIQTAIGAGDSWRVAPFMLRWIVKISNLRVAYADHDEQEKVLMQSNLDWTIVRPVGLTNSYRKKKISIDYTTRPGQIISRRAVAEFMIDSLETDTYVKKALIISEKWGPY